MTAFDHLEDAPAVPLFPVEPVPPRPDDKTKWPEHYRQSSFVAHIRKRAPSVLAFSNANEGVRSTNGGKRMKQAGLTPGVPDCTILWDGGIAFAEFKGFYASGAPGKLSEDQIRIGNKIHRNGWPVACFYTATAALAWLREQGAPVP